MSSPATPIEDEAQRVIPIEQIKGPFVHRASMNGTPAEDHHALLKMAQDVRRDLAFPSAEVTETHRTDWGSRFDKDDARTMSHLAQQLRFFEWEASQWALFQPYRQNHLEKDISREELCRAYYRWLVDAIERRDELVRTTTTGRCTSTPSSRASTAGRGKNQNNVNSLHGAIALPEPEIQQPTRPAKRKRAPCALTRELRSLIQLGGPGNALVGRAVVIEPDNADEQEPQENGPDVAGWGRRLRRRLNGRVVSPES
ncbi:hypothetical protein N0V85_005903 [Neurospora sp. IMI 360204]|nr:hypothetical protein N0V85_005903 [Neurospora sp. IMI 360204]